MIVTFLARIGLSTLKSQLIVGAFAIAVVVIPIIIINIINGIKSDIEEKAVGEVVNALKDDRIKTLTDGKKVDEKILQSDDDVICDILGGCL